VDPKHVYFLCEQQKPTMDVVRTWIDSESMVAIAHVRNRTHFVLTVGYDTADDTIVYVHDPFYHVNTYAFADIADMLVYWMS